MFRYSVTWFDQLGAFLKMGIPMGLTQLLLFSFQIVDVLMIGRLGSDYLAAATVGGTIYFTLFVIGLGPAVAIAPLVSQSIGAAQAGVETDVRLSLRMGLWIVGLLFPICLTVLLYTEVIALALGQPADIAVMAQPFAVALAPVLPTALGFIILRNFLAALGKTYVPLWFVAMGIFVNAAFNYALIYGNWGAPRLELAGAGIASSISQAFMFLATVAYVYRDAEARRFHLFRDFFHPHIARLREVLKLAWPIGVEIGLWLYLNVAMTLLMGMIGAVEVAAFGVARNSVGALAVMAAVGLSQAGGIQIGLAAGAQDWAAARRIWIIAMGGCLLTTLFFVVPILALPETIAGIYLDAEDTHNVETLSLVTQYLPIACLFVFMDVAMFTTVGCLRALKDVRIPMILAGLCYWVLAFPIAFGFGLWTSWGGFGIWMGLFIGVAVAALLLALRLQRLLSYNMTLAVRGA